MKPKNLKTKIFLDSGNPEDTQKALHLLGFLDGQTTNPSLVAKNPEVQSILSAGSRLSRQQLYQMYKDIIIKISSLIPNGSISIEVYADNSTKMEDMMREARMMNTWAPNAHIKFPTNIEGLKAAEQAVKEGIRVNMTLCFTQEQAVAVYLATLEGASQETLPGFKNVFISPFVGRLDDRGENGMDLVKNIIEMYSKSDFHVGVLTASVRGIDHFMTSLAYGADIITAPLNVLEEWVRKGMLFPDENYQYDVKSLSPIPFKNIDLNTVGIDWKTIHFAYPLIEAGIEKFSADWNDLVGS